MKKENHYFSHDCNARNREKLLAVRVKYALEGYAAYFMILEKIMESSDYRLPRQYDLIAFDLQAPAELVRSIVEDFDLFTLTEDGKYFYSEGFNRRMSLFIKGLEQKREAGIKSGIARRKKRGNGAKETEK